MKLLISFSYYDRFFANVLKKALLRFDYRIWFYLHEIISKDRIESKLRREISSCDLMLLVITSNSINSPWVNWEIDYAISNETSSGKLKILPILMAGKNLPSQLLSRSFIDFRSADLIAKNFYKLVSLLIRAYFKSEYYYSYKFVPDLKKIYDLLFGENNYAIIRSPLGIIGTFYNKRWEDEPPFVKLDDDIQEGKIVCLIYVMNILNQIESDYIGKVVGIFIDNNEPVTYDQPLMVIAFK